VTKQRKKHLVTCSCYKIFNSLDFGMNTVGGILLWSSRDRAAGPLRTFLPLRTWQVAKSRCFFFHLRGVPMNPYLVLTCISHARQLDSLPKTFHVYLFVSYYYYPHRVVFMALLNFVTHLDTFY